MTARTWYDERLTAPVWLWAVAAVLASSLGLALLVPLGPWAGGAALAVSAGLSGWGLLAGAARVQVTAAELRAGPARIPLALLGAVEPLDARRAAELRGPASDPAAYHLIRGWVTTAVRVEVVDPADPTPYWYVATRRPRELAGALLAAKAAMS